jgi:hypothetical protein
MPEIDNGKRAHNEPPRDGVFASQLVRRFRRGRHTAIGVVGVALLGTGAFVTTDLITSAHTTKIGEIGALTPLASDPASAPTSSSAAEHSAPSAAVRATTTASDAPQTVAERVAAAKAAGAKSGGWIKRPLPNTNKVTDAEVTVRQIGSLKEARGTMRIVSARQDLTGQRELAWAADKGLPVGDASCTKKIRLSPDAEIREIPTLLLCWRTSAAKSVYIVAVKLNGGPSKQAIVGEIDRVWSKLS